MFLTPAEAAEVRDRFGTPCYVYDRATLTAQAQNALQFPNAFGFQLRFAMKANPNHAILKLFRSLGLLFWRLSAALGSSVAAAGRSSPLHY